MTFDEILEQVITLLKRQGRVTYRSLKLRFDLDDEYLDVLKDEIIEAHQIAVDENGRVLVWTGKTEGHDAQFQPLVERFDGRQDDFTDEGGHGLIWAVMPLSAYTPIRRIHPCAVSKGLE